MNVSLTSELEKYVQTQVESQRYQTASEVIRHALRQMQDTEKFEQAELEALRQTAKVVLDQIQRGEYVQLRTEQEKKAFFEGVKRRGRERLVPTKRRSA